MGEALASLPALASVLAGGGDAALGLSVDGEVGEVALGEVVALSETAGDAGDLGSVASAFGLVGDAMTSELRWEECC